MHAEWIRKQTAGTAIVFVHGILSSGESCWLNANGSFWPRLFAEEVDACRCGIYVFTYKTGVFSGSYRLSDVVDALKEHLRLDRVLDNSCLIFVAHSMGGIVVRKFLVERARDLADRYITVGLFLVASPSLGSKYANWLSPLARLLKHNQAEALRFCQQNAWLMDLDKEFFNLKESCALRLFGKELVEDQFVIFPSLIRRQVVEPFAGFRYFGEAYRVPNSDHFSIAKPESRDAIQERLLLEFVLKVERADRSGLTPTTEATYSNKTPFVHLLTPPSIAREEVEAASNAITLIAAKIFDSITARTLGEIGSRLNTSSLAHILVTSMHRYAEIGGLQARLLKAMLDRNSFLASDELCNDLRQLVVGVDQPSVTLVAKWRSAVPDAPWWVPWDSEAESFMAILQHELGLSGKHGSTDAVRSFSTVVSHLLTTLSTTKDWPPSIELSRRNAGPHNARRLLDFQRTLYEFTDGFVGRDFVFSELRAFADQNDSGYFVIAGRPGTGKTAVLASLVCRFGYEHHFNIYSTGLRSVLDLMGNLNARLASKYAVPTYEWTDAQLRNGHLFTEMLGNVSATLSLGKKEILVIDALDEGDGDGACGNVMCLPETLPRGIFVVCSTREPMTLISKGPRKDLIFEEYGSQTAQDIAGFIASKTDSPALKSYLAMYGYHVETFIQELTEKSLGNFRYVRHVIGDIERSDNAQHSQRLTELPDGLLPYYRFQWERMKELTRTDWEQTSLPVLIVLGAITAPVSRDMIASFAAVPSVKVSAILRDWSAYIQRELAVNDSQAATRYRLFHFSFTEFIRERARAEYSEVLDTVQSRISELMLNNYLTEV